MLELIEINPKNSPEACVIWLHGLGADGNDFVDIVPQLQLPIEASVRFIFPHAPIRKVAWAGNMPMRAWFNVYQIDRASQDEEGIRESQALIDDLINAVIAQGVAANKIVLAGFSQGGAMALQCGLRCVERLAGIMVLSGWLPLAKFLAAERTLVNQDTPILLQHGSVDNLIPVDWAYETKKHLEELNYAVKFNTYPMAHSVCLEEVTTIGLWLSQLISR